MFAAAPSKVPYYIAGGLLALWAVLLAIWGISHTKSLAPRREASS